MNARITPRERQLAGVDEEGIPYYETAHPSEVPASAYADYATEAERRDWVNQLTNEEYLYAVDKIESLRFHGGGV